MKTLAGNVKAAQAGPQHRSEARDSTLHNAPPPTKVDSRAASLTMQRFEDLATSAPETTQLRQRAAFMSAHPGSSKMQHLQQMADSSPRAAQLKRQAAGDASTPVAPARHEAKPNNTGLPDQLKSGIEALSSMNMDHVKVHYNSAKPAQLQAHAYAQGSEIHVAPGQEKHLPHEAWHVVQQAQGRVRPTMQMKRGTQVNDDAGLEAEADVMGARAMQLVAAGPSSAGINPSTSSTIMQLMGVDITWGSIASEVVATNVKTTREGYAKGNHTTGHSAMRVAVENAILGRTYARACNELFGLYVGLSQFPGWESVADRGSLDGEFDAHLAAASNETIAANHTHRIKALVDIYEKAWHKLPQTYRSGAVGGVGPGGSNQEADRAAELREARDGDASSWHKGATGSFDSRGWNPAYGDKDQNTMDAIIRHCLSLPHYKEAPDEYIEDVVRELLFQMAQGGAKDETWQKEMTAKIMDQLRP